MIHKDRHVLGITSAFSSSTTTLVKGRRCEKDCPKRQESRYLNDLQLFKTSCLQRSARWLVGFWCCFNFKEAKKCTAVGQACWAILAPLRVKTSFSDSIPSITSVFYLMDLPFAV